MEIAYVLCVYWLLLLCAYFLNRMISRRPPGSVHYPGQKAIDVVVGVAATLAASYLVSDGLADYPFFSSTVGIYLTVLFSFVVSGIWMILGDIKHDKGAKNG